MEALCWAAGDRLFGAGLGGDITEYDLARLCVACSVDGCGGPIWSMAVDSSGTQLAVSATGTGTALPPPELGRLSRGGGGKGSACPAGADPDLPADRLRGRLG